MKFLAFCVTAFLLVCCEVTAERVPMDFDADGRSEFAAVEILSDGRLSFSATNLTSGAVTDLGILGKVGDQIALANWVGDQAPEVGVVSSEADQSLKWSILSAGQVISKIFGKVGDIAIAGADLDNDGQDDPVVAYGVEGRKMEFQIALGLFSKPNPEIKTMQFGFSSEMPFIFKGVSGDVLGLLQNSSKSSAIRLSSIGALTAKRVSARSSLPKALPLAVGIDKLVSVSEVRGRSQVNYFSSSSRAPQSRFVFKESGTPIVGDFIPTAPGLEVAIHVSGELLVRANNSRRVQRFSVGEGIAIDEVNINKTAAKSSDPAPQPEDPIAPGPQPPSTGAPVNPNSLDPKLRAVCESVTTIGAGDMLIKSEISKHISPTDRRASGYTLVCASQCPQNLNFAQFFYANGTQAGAVAIYGYFSGNGRPRMYGAVGQAPAHSARDIAATARGIGNGKLYMQISSETAGAGTECKEFSPQGRNGSL